MQLLELWHISLKDSEVKYPKIEKASGVSINFSTAALAALLLTKIYDL